MYIRNNLGYYGGLEGIWGNTETAEPAPTKEPTPTTETAPTTEPAPTKEPIPTEPAPATSPKTTTKATATTTTKGPVDYSMRTGQIPIHVNYGYPGYGTRAPIYGYGYPSGTGYGPYAPPPPPGYYPPQQQQPQVIVMRDRDRGHRRGEGREWIKYGLPSVAVALLLSAALFGK